MQDRLWKFIWYFSQQIQAEPIYCKVFTVFHEEDITQGKVVFRSWKYKTSGLPKAEIVKSNHSWQFTRKLRDK